MYSLPITPQQEQGWNAWHGSTPISDHVQVQIVVLNYVICNKHCFASCLLDLLGLVDKGTPPGVHRLRKPNQPSPL